jgi:hypothetical protein
MITLAPHIYIVDGQFTTTDFPKSIAAVESYANFVLGRRRRSAGGLSTT